LPTDKKIKRRIARKNQAGSSVFLP